MSSKRKNTPTKLSKEDQASDKSAPSTGNCDLDVDASSEKSASCCSSIGISEDTEDITVAESEEGDDDSYLDRQLELACSTSHGLKRSGHCQSASESDVDDNCSSPYVATKTLTLNPNSTLGSISGSLSAAFGEHPCKRSMESVLRRLNSRVNDVSMEMAFSVDDFDDSPKVMSAVHAVLAGDGTLIEKERQISEIISHLQNIRENLSKQKHQSVHRHTDDSRLATAAVAAA
ncbi:unnamed protein product, partial [Candidula unifasciata]